MEELVEIGVMVSIFDLVLVWDMVELDFFVLYWSFLKFYYLLEVFMFSYEEMWI